MRLPLILLAAAAQSSDVFACSLAVREHPILASHVPVATKDGRTTIRIAVSEALLPAKFAKTQYPFERIWLGLRGQKLDEVTGAVSPEFVEITGKIDVMCFYPGDAYEVLPDGRIIVWISGKLQFGSPLTLLLPTADPQTEDSGNVWRTVRWGVEEGDNSSALPSHPQPGIIQP